MTRFNFFRRWFQRSAPDAAAAQVENAATGKLMTINVIFRNGQGDVKFHQARYLGVIDEMVWIAHPYGVTRFPSDVILSIDDQDTDSIALAATKGEVVASDV